MKGSVRGRVFLLLTRRPDEGAFILAPRVPEIWTHVVVKKLGLHVTGAWWVPGDQLAYLTPAQQVFPGHTVWTP